MTLLVLIIMIWILSVNTDVELSPPHTYSDNVNNNFNVSYTLHILDNITINYFGQKTAERGLVYADIGQSSFNRLQRPLLSIPALEDTPIEYARINHKSLSDKQRNSPITFDGTTPIYRIARKYGGELNLAV